MTWVPRDSCWVWVPSQSRRAAIAEQWADVGFCLHEADVSLRQLLQAMGDDDPDSDVIAELQAAVLALQLRGEIAMLRLSGATVVESTSPSH